MASDPQFPLNEQMIEEILSRIGSTKYLIQAASLSKAWCRSSSEEQFLQRFRAHRATPLLGFVVEFRQMVWNFSVFVPYSGLESGLAKICSLMEETFQCPSRAFRVLDTLDSRILVSDSGNPNGYEIRSPSDPRFVAPPHFPIIPRLEHPSQSTTYGQFAIPGDSMCFFVKDQSRNVDVGFGGVTMESTVMPCVMVSVLANRSWNLHVSPAVHVGATATFHASPHCLLQGASIYMMYIVGKVHCFNKLSSTFSEIQLPPEVQNDNNSGGRDYRIGKSGGGLTLVQGVGSLIKTWVLSKTSTWTLMGTHDLSEIFGLGAWNRMAYRSEWDYHLDDNELFSILIETVGEGAEFVCVGFGFTYSLFFVDLFKRQTSHIANTLDYGLLSKITPVSMPWPPKFPKLLSG